MFLDPKKLFESVDKKLELPELCVEEPGSAAPTAHSSCLCLPDDLLMTWQPVILIRNPALMFPSLARAEIDTERRLGGPHDAAVMTLSWTRDLYEWFSKRGIQPLVIDADDIIKDPGVVREVCHVTGMDPDAVITEWGQ